VASVTSSPCRIIGISGSLQARSANGALLELARSSAPGDVELAIFDGLRAIPPFDPDTSDADAPGAVLALRRALAGSDAVLIASPEYGFSLPGALKNAIDWVIGSGELEGKVVGITAAVKIQGRGQRGLAALAEPLRAVSARIMGGWSIVQGPSFEREVAALVQAIVDEVRRPASPPDHGMGYPRASALVLEWVDRLNRRDADALALLYARDAIVQPMARPSAAGRPGIRTLYAERFATSPPAVTAESIFEDGASAILEWRDASGRRGCTSFAVRHSEFTLQRDYASSVA